MAHEADDDLYQFIDGGNVQLIVGPGRKKVFARTSRLREATHFASQLHDDILNEPIELTAEDPNTMLDLISVLHRKTSVIDIMSGDLDFQQTLKLLDMATKYGANSVVSDITEASKDWIRPAATASMPKMKHSVAVDTLLHLAAKVEEGQSAYAQIYDHILQNHLVALVMDNPKYGQKAAWEELITRAKACAKLFGDIACYKENIAPYASNIRDLTQGGQAIDRASTAHQLRSLEGFKTFHRAISKPRLRIADVVVTSITPKPLVLSMPEQMSAAPSQAKAPEPQSILTTAELQEPPTLQLARKSQQNAPAPTSSIPPAERQPQSTSHHAEADFWTLRAEASAKLDSLLHAQDMPAEPQPVSLSDVTPSAGQDRTTTGLPTTTLPRITAGSLHPAASTSAPTSTTSTSLTPTSLIVKLKLRPEARIRGNLHGPGGAISNPSLTTNAQQQVEKFDRTIELRRDEVQRHTKASTQPYTTTLPTSSQREAKDSNINATSRYYRIQLSETPIDRPTTRSTKNPHSPLQILPLPRQYRRNSQTRTRSNDYTKRRDVDSSSEDDPIPRKRLRTAQLGLSVTELPTSEDDDDDDNNDKADYNLEAPQVEEEADLRVGALDGANERLRHRAEVEIPKKAVGQIGNRSFGGSDPSRQRKDKCPCICDPSWTCYICEEREQATRAGQV